jgi:hypothetical protein
VISSKVTSKGKRVASYIQGTLHTKRHVQEHVSDIFAKC